MKSSKIFIKVFASLILLAAWPPPAQNCGFTGYGDDARVWILLPAISNIPTLFSRNYRLGKTSGYDEVPAWFKRNIIEWREVVGQEVNADDLNTILYETPGKEYFEQAYAADNTFMKRLESPDLKEVKEYLDFAKICETHMSWDGRYDKWFKEGFSDLEKVAIYGESLLEKAESPWVRLRLAYKLSRVYAYLDLEEKEKELLENHILTSKLQESWIVGSARIDQIEDLDSSGIKKNYLLAKAYQHTPSEQDRIIKAFDKTLCSEVIALTKNREEKAVVSFLCQVENPGRTLEGMDFIERVNPGMPELKFLLAKEINKIEDWIFTPIILDPHIYSFSGFYDDETGEWRVNEQNKQERLLSDINYVSELRKFIDKVIEHKKQPDLYFWKITGAYLAFMQSDFTKARILLNSVDPNADMSITMRMQYKTTEALVSIFEGEKLTEKTRREIYDLFQFIEANEVYGQEDFKSEVALLLSNCLISRGYKPEGVLVLANNTKPFDSFSFYLSKNMYHRMLDTYEVEDYAKTLQIIRNPQTPFEEWLSNTPRDYSSFWGDFEEYIEDEETGEWVARKKKQTWDMDKILDYQSTALMMDDQWDEAIRSLEQISEDYYRNSSWSSYLWGNPFSIGLFAADSTVMQDSTKTVEFNKLTMAREIKSLLAKVKASGGKDQESLFLIANAHYSMSYFGDWWLATYPAKGYGVINSAYAVYPKANTENAEDLGTTWPGSNSLPITWVLGMTLLGLVLVKKKKTGLGMLLLMAGIAFYWTACNLKGKNMMKFDLPLQQVHNTALNSYYFEGAKAIEYYEKANALNPNSDLGIAAGFMVERIAKQSAVALKKIGITFVTESKAKKTKTKNYNITVSCLTFENYLRENGITFRSE